MKKTLRIAALLAAFILVLAGTLCSCSSSKDKNNISEDECILTVAGHEVSYGLYRYFFLNYKAAYTDEQLSADSSKIYDEIKKNVYESLCGMYAIVAMCAEYGISTDDAEIQKSVDATIASVMEQYRDEQNDKTGKRGYEKQLAENFMTEAVFRFVCAVDLCEEQLFMKMTAADGAIPSDDATVREAFESEFIRVLQVYINTLDTKRSYDECKALAESVCKSAQAGSDFDNLVAENSNDYTMTRDGYYMPRGWMDESFEQVAFSLEVGEVSDVLELGDGFHIIKRYEKDDEYMEKNFEMLKERYLTCKFYEKVDVKAATVKVSETERFSKILPENISLG